jgi:hypothetical protein
MWTLDLFSPLFAWSAHGHATLTSMAFAGALARLITHRDGYLFQQVRKHYSALVTYGVFSPFVVVYHAAGNTACRTVTKVAGEAPPAEDVDGTLLRREMDANPVVHRAFDRNVAYLFEDLPGIVVNEDVHLGNLPGKAGEFFDANGQVRHFMRSRSDVTAWDAYKASYEHVAQALRGSWQDFKGALHDRSGFWGEIADIAGGVAGARGLLFRGGLDKLGSALHTLEDSFAPGHVGRGRDGMIEDVHIWDAANRDANAAAQWEGHHAYDNPSNARSSLFYAMARDNATEVVFTLLSTLNAEPEAYSCAMRNVLYGTFAHRLLSGEAVRPRK